MATDFASFLGPYRQMLIDYVGRNDLSGNLWNWELDKLRHPTAYSSRSWAGQVSDWHGAVQSKPEHKGKIKSRTGGCADLQSNCLGQVGSMTGWRMNLLQWTSTAALHSLLGDPSRLEMLRLGNQITSFTFHLFWGSTWILISTANIAKSSIDETI